MEGEYHGKNICLSDDRQNEQGYYKEGKHENSYFQ